MLFTFIKIANDEIKILLVGLAGPCNVYYMSIKFFVRAHRKRVCRLMKIQLCWMNKKRSTIFYTKHINISNKNCV